MQAIAPSKKFGPGDISTGKKTEKAIKTNTYGMMSSYESISTHMSYLISI